MEPESPFDRHIKRPAQPPRWPDPVPHAPAMSVRTERARRRSAGRFVRSAFLGAAAVALVVVGVHFLTGTVRQKPVNLTAVGHRVDLGVVDVNADLSYAGGGAAGTGMVLTSGGEVLTNNHVVDGATSVQVVDVGNGRTYSATVVGTDVTDDVAVLQLQGASNLSIVTTGDSSNVAVGDSIAAIGNAGGVGGTPSIAAGHVTALGQSITALDDVNGSSENLTGLIQTDAAIQPGDSGGPLVNARGLVIGMDTAASSGMRFQSQGATAGFAIPISRALSIATQIEGGNASGNVHVGPTAFLGVDIETPNGTSTPGVEIKSVLHGFPAASAGLETGDVITAIDGVAVSTPSELTHQMQRFHPGQTVPLSWTDTSGQSHTQQITLASGPSA
jgi:S1-C subfamily serine protease